MKYELDFNDYKLVENTKVYRIIALKNFGNVKAGDKGGYIKKDNLSHEGNCWVFDNAIITDNAFVKENAMINDNVIVKGNVRVFGNVEILDNVVIDNNAVICGDATIYNNAVITGNAIVGNYVKISNEAVITDNAKVLDDSIVSGKAIIKGIVKGCAKITDNAVISMNQTVSNGVVKTDLSKNLIENIRCQTGLLAFNDKVIAYKQVKKDLTSFHDNSFQYEVGKTAEAKNSSNGLYFSNANFWNDAEDILKSTFLIAEINLTDIITVQNGVIICKKAFILGKYDI